MPFLGLYTCSTRLKAISHAVKASQQDPGLVHHATRDSTCHTLQAECRNGHSGNSPTWYGMPNSQML